MALAVIGHWHCLAAACWRQQAACDHGTSACTGWPHIGAMPVSRSSNRHTAALGAGRESVRVSATGRGSRIGAGECHWAREGACIMHAGAAQWKRHPRTHLSRRSLQLGAGTGSTGRSWMMAHANCTTSRVELTRCRVRASYTAASSFRQWYSPPDGGLAERAQKARQWSLACPRRKATSRKAGVGGAWLGKDAIGAL
jgi:hypothetical protein